MVLKKQSKLNKEVKNDVVITAESIPPTEVEDVLLTEGIPPPNTPITRVYKQIELSDADIAFLGSNQYSEDAWLSMGLKHSFDPDTRKSIPGTNNRAFEVVHKKYPQIPPVGGIVTTTENMASKPIPASQIRAAMLKRDLTKPTSDEVSEEEV